MMLLTSGSCTRYVSLPVVGVALCLGACSTGQRTNAPAAPSPAQAAPGQVSQPRVSEPVAPQSSGALTARPMAPVRPWQEGDPVRARDDLREEGDSAVMRAP